MYECCNIKRFLKLLLLDAIIFSLCLILFFAGRFLFFVIFPELSGKERAQPVTSTCEELETQQDESTYISSLIV